MAKRLTDTEKWKDDWYIQLSNDDKIVWQWLLDNCSHAGICKKSIGLLNLMCKVKYSENQMVEKMENRIVPFDNSWFIPKFIKFQYTTLNSSKPVILSVVKELFQHNIVHMIPESFGNDYKIIGESFDNHCQMIKDKDKSKDKDRDSIKGGVWGKNGHRLGKRGIDFCADNCGVIFPDGSTQELGTDQKALLEMGKLKPSDIFKGMVN